MSASSKKKLRKANAAAELTERQKKEQAEAKKLRNISVAFIVVMLAVALTAASILAIRAINNTGIIDRNTIAAVTGEHELNSIQMNYYFTDYVKGQYNQWQASYGSNLSVYTSMMGLNINKPLDDQVKDQKTGETWAAFFLNEALEQAKSDYALYDLAMADETFSLTEDQQKALDTTVEQLKLYAAYYGYKNVNKYLASIYGYGADADSYAEYAKVSTIASAYYAKHSDSLSYDDAAIGEREKENPNNYSSFSYASYYLSANSFLTGGTKDEATGNTVYTDEQKAASIKAAEEAANSLTSSKNTVELDKAIAALEINKNNKDAASTKNSSVMYPQVPAAIQSWLADKARVANEIAVIANESTSKDADGKETKTILGYYVVVFESRNDNLRPLANVRHLLVEFEGGKTDANGNKTYSDEEKATAKAEAERLLQVWKDGKATEETFIELVKEHSDDGSAEDGGLFEDIHTKSNYVDSFKTWSLDTARKAGDTGVILSDYGYHVMYYVGDDDLTYRDYLISEELRAEDMEKWYEEILKPVTITKGKTNRLNLDMILSYS